MCQHRVFCHFNGRWVLDPYDVWVLLTVHCKGLSSWYQCKGAMGYTVHDVGHYTSGSPSSGGAVITKAIDAVPTLILLTSVIKWSLTSDVAFCLVATG